MSHRDAHAWTTTRIAPLPALPSGIDVLRAEAAGEGFRFMDRLVTDWRSGANRFALPGETFLACRLDAELVAVGGLNQDPLAPQADIGRIRHVYVKRSARRRGVGSSVVTQLLACAADVFQTIRLRTDSPEAAEFYIRLGFRPVDGEEASHAISLPRYTIGHWL